MAKRFTSITKPNKKIKLDVSVGAGHFCTNTSNVADLWGSDDDDFILLATQIEEKKQHPPDDGSRHKDGILSFSQFVPQANDNTSTQQQFGAQMTTNSSQCPMPTTSSYRRPDDDMLMNNILSELVEDQTDLGVDGNGQWTGQAAANRRQLAQERQLKFLMERVDVLKKENTKLQKDIIDHNNQTLTKEGEVSLYNSVANTLRPKNS